MEAATGRAGRAAREPGVWLALGASALALATIAFGLTASAGGTDLGTASPPFTWRWRPELGPWSLPALVLLPLSIALAPRLCAAHVSPLRFALSVLALGLALRLVFGVARDGIGGLYHVYEIGRYEASNEYLPALPALDFGARLFLDTFAEIGTSLPVHAIGHPPGLLLSLHWLGIDGAPGMAALTIGVGALSLPLAYLLARSLLGERRARVATLLLVFSPSAILYGATSSDALYATAALLAALALVSRRRAVRALGPPALALAAFFSYANLAIGAWAAVLVARREGIRRATALAAGCAAGLALFHLALHLVTGYDPIGVLEATESVYREGIASRRPYAFWAFGSPVAYLVALGPPIAWFALRAAGARHAPALALLVVLVTAAVLGFSKAETERIYQFLVPLACISAAITLPERRLPLVLSLLGAQALATEVLLYTVW